LARAGGETEFASPQTLHEAEHHVKTLLAENYAVTTEIVSDARAALDAIAHDLIERETITGDHVRQVIAANSPPIVKA
jgi:ATP-dependent Zn protease